MLDLEAFSFLTRALESPLAPLVILASNRGLTPIHIHNSASGTPEVPPMPHGIPPDLLARLLIIPTHPYKPQEIASILRTRVKTEGINITDAGLDKISQIGTKVSLRYALQLLAPAAILAKVKVGGAVRGEVGVDEIEECESLFLDASRSSKGLANEKGFLV